MMRRARRFLLLAAAALLLPLLALVLLAVVFQDEVKERLVAGLNAHLLVPVQQQGIELTLIERFPRASLRLDEVLIHLARTDSTPADTLLYARSLYLEIGLLAMLRGDYTVSRLHGVDVRLHPAVDRNGQGNWNIWRADTTTGDDAAAVELRKATFDGLRVRYQDARSDLSVHLASEALELGGRLSAEGSTMTAKGDVHVLEVRKSGSALLTDRRAGLALRAEFGGEDGHFRLVKGSELLIDEAPIAVELAYAGAADARTLDLRANGFKLDLAAVMELLPPALHRRLRHYDLAGEMDLALRYAGPVEGAGPALSLGLTVRDGRLKEQRSGVRFNDVRGELALDLDGGGALRKLVVRHLHARAPSGTLGGDVELAGRTKAKLKADVHGDLALSDLLRFARIDTLEEAGGRLKAAVRMSGTLRDAANIQRNDLRALTITGQATLANASLKLKGVRHRLTDLNAELALNGNDATVSGLRCSVQGSPIELTGTLRDLVPYLLLPDQRLVIEARGRSERLDMGALIGGTRPAGEGSAASGPDLRLPPLIALDLGVEVGQLVYEDFTAEAIRGTVQLEDRVLRVAPITLRTADGAVEGSLVLDGRPADAYPLRINAHVKDMDIARLFREFRDFGQDFLTAQHIRGRSNIELTLQADLFPSMRLDQEGLHVLADVSVSNGELIGHGPMMAVADHVRSNKLIAPFVDTQELSRRLQHVRFATLRNQVEIRDRTVFVPQMLVRSDAMDIEVSAAQTFDGGVDDHLNFRLGDLFRMGQAGEDEFGPVADDGTGMRIFLHMFGTTDDLRFANDGAAAAARRNQRIKQEAANLKNLLAGTLRGDNGVEAPPANVPLITLEGPGAEDAAAPGRPVKRRKGLGRLLDPEEDAGREKVTVE
jgi:uncharacterized protein involved in outer membrane biogenesis